jgi:uncharacterized protein YukE
MTMAEANDTQSLLEGLASIRAILEQARAHLGELHDGMSDTDTGERSAADPEPHIGGWNPWEDLCLQIENALEHLDQAIEGVSTECYHVDQQVTKVAAEVAHG